MTALNWVEVAIDDLVSGLQTLSPDLPFRFCFAVLHN